MKSFYIRLIPGLVILIAFLVILLWGLCPTSFIVHTFPLSPADMQLPTPEGRLPMILPTPSIPAVLPEHRLLVVEFPKQIRVGDSATLRLSLEVDVQGTRIPTAELLGEQAEGMPDQFSDVFNTHQVMAEARLDMAGMHISPQGEISQILQPGRSITFLWNLQPNETGSYKGVLWLHLRLISLSNGEQRRMVLANQRVEVRAVRFLGLGGKTARWLGGIGCILGFFLCLDSILSAVGKVPEHRSGDQ